jgi:hypothetical protein
LPDDPDPTVIATDPPRPILAAPLPIITYPLLPDEAVPDEKTSMPDDPAVPALVERIFTDPLDVAVPSPEPKATLPP